MQTELKNRIEIRESTMIDVADILISALHVNVVPDELDPDAPLFGSGLGLDSVDAVVLIAELEARFKINISEEDGRNAMRSINSLIDLIIRKKHGNA
jgi:acyl carrier protein